jgi:hypothetical protein
LGSKVANIVLVVLAFLFEVVDRLLQYFHLFLSGVVDLRAEIRLA